jgi:tetratricopeptide (TPR) repeat protein
MSEQEFGVAERIGIQALGGQRVLFILGGVLAALVIMLTLFLRPYWQGDAEGWVRLGTMELRIGNLAGAEASFNTARAIGERRRDSGIIAAAAQGLGRVHAVRFRLYWTEEKVAARWKSPSDRRPDPPSYALSQFDKAETLFNEALTLDQAGDRQASMAASYMELEKLYRAREDNDRADAMGREAALLSEALTGRDLPASYYTELAALQEARGRLDETLRLYQHALRLAGEESDRIELDIGLLQLRDESGVARLITSATSGRSSSQSENCCRRDR